MCRRRPSTRMIVIATCTLLAFSSSIVHTFADELQQLNQVRMMLIEGIAEMVLELDM